MVAREKGEELTTFVAQGEMSPEEILTALSHFLEAGASRLTLWDLSNARLSEVPAESIRAVARRMAQLGKGRRPKGRAAVVCGRLADILMARLLAAYLAAEGYPAEVAAFTNTESARAWVAGTAPK